jgi:hypothetical protein
MRNCEGSAPARESVTAVVALEPKLVTVKVVGEELVPSSTVS